MNEPSLREWLDGAEAAPDDTGDTDVPTPAARRSPRRLWIVAALTWAVVAGVVVALVRTPPPSGDPHPSEALARGAEDAAPRSPEHAAAEPGTARPSRPAHVTAPATGVAGAATSGRDAAVAATAVVAVRLARTAHEPDGRTRYVDLALPSDVAWHGDVAVVTVDAVVLDGAADGWQPPRLARFAQAVLAEPGAPPRPLGRPWVLPAPPAEGEPPVLEPLDDPEASGAAAIRLADAGYADVEVAGLARLTHAPGLVVVTATARAPGEDRAGTHHVWLAEGAEGAVLGLHDPDTGGPSPPGQEEEP